MKTLLLLLAILVSIKALAQPTDQYAAFSAQKKSILLSTGITMKYIDTGKANGTPVIFLHGITDTGRSFQTTIEELKKINNQLRIIVPDLRGHGGTSLPDKNKCAGAPENCLNPADFALDIIALMDQKQIAKAHFVGHSMGSIISQELALKYPDRVSSLVLIGTFVNGKESRAIHEFLQAGIIDGKFKPVLAKRPNFSWPKDAYTLTARDLGPEVTNFLKENWVTEIATNPAYLAAIYPETIDVPLGTWIGMVKALGKMDNREALANLKAPTLVLHASQDMMILQSDQEHIKSALTQAAKNNGTTNFFKMYGKIPLPASGIQENDLGHNLQWAVPQQIAADVAAFIKNGSPVANLTYVNPQNTKQVLTDENQSNIIIFRQESKF
ncbi:MAG: alpha/beta hydrolase [Bacteroidota bacterium]|nr:alpha/beta hydrolase [Bacteroidota bacterium]